MTIKETANGVWWVNDNGQWKMYDYRDLVGSDFTHSEIEALKAQYGYTLYDGQYLPPRPTPTPTPYTTEQTQQMARTTPMPLPEALAPYIRGEEPRQSQAGGMLPEALAPYTPPEWQTEQTPRTQQEPLPDTPWGQQNILPPGTNVLPEGIPGYGEAPGTSAIGQIPQSEAFGYGAAPYAGWLNRLMEGGMYGYSPAQQWARYQYGPSMQNFELANQLRGLQGQPETEWGQAPFRSALDPGLWGQALGAQGTQMGQDWIGQNPQNLWDIGVGNIGGGRVTPFTNWLSQEGQYGTQRAAWEAQHQPGVQGTTGTPWLNYIRGYMGI